MPTILDTLENAQFNFKTFERMVKLDHPIFKFGLNQLDNALQSLENGLDLYDEINTEAEVKP